MYSGEGKHSNPWCDNTHANCCRIWRCLRNYRRLDDPRTKWNRSYQEGVVTDCVCCEMDTERPGRDH